MLSLYIAHLQGSIVKEIVEKNAKGFSVQMLKWVAIAVSVRAPIWHGCARARARARA